MKFFGDRLARTGVVQRFEAFHLFHLARKLLQERPLHVLLGDLVVDDDGIRAGRYQSAPDFRGQRLVDGKPFGFRKRLQGLLGILAELAVDLARRKIGAVEKNLRLYDCGIDLVVGRRLSLEFRAVDRRCVHAGKGGTDKTHEQDQPGKHADHRQSPKYGVIRIWTDRSSARKCLRQPAGGEPGVRGRPRRASRQTGCSITWRAGP